MKQIKDSILKILKEHGAENGYVHISQTNLKELVGAESTLTVKYAIEELEKEERVEVQRNLHDKNGYNKFFYKVIEKKPIVIDGEEFGLFEHEEFGEVRAVTINERPYFVGIDIAKALGYKRPKDAVSAHCKGAVKYSLPTNGGKQLFNVIPEGDMYRLIIKSKLPSAEKFESWVMEEVLPQIRMTGGYIPINQQETTEEFLARALIVAEKTYANKEKLLKQRLNGWGERSTLTEGVQILGIDGIITTDICKGLANAGYGTYDIPFGKSNRVFIPNDRLLSKYAVNGYLTSSNVIGSDRPRLDFRKGFFYSIKEEQDIITAIIRARMDRVGY